MKLEIGKRRTSVVSFGRGDGQVLDRPPVMNTFIKELPRRVKRNALRTLRGRMLRTELYALDSTTREDRPYTVTEYLHGVTGLPVNGSWPANPTKWQKDVFFPASPGPAHHSVGALVTIP